MKPDGQVLERNLAALMRRAYVPALPRAEFRRAALALARDEAQQRRRGPRRFVPYLAAGAAAAAGFLLWVGLRAGSPGAPPQAASAAELVARGEVALRLTGEPVWRAASAEERAAGLTLADAGALEVETPVLDAAAALTARTADAEAALGPATRARLAALPDAAFGTAGPGRGAELAGGELALTLGPRSATWWIATEAGLVRVEPLSALDARRAAGRTSVRLVHGTAVLERADGARIPLAPGPFTALDGALLAPAGADGGRELVQTSRPSGEEALPAAEREREEPAPEPPSGASVRGRVRDAAGAPVTRFRVLLLRDAEVPDVAEPLLKDCESADGAFAWDGVRPDRYEVFVEAKGFAQHRTGVLELAAGTPRELDVTLGAGRGLHGWVLERDTETPLPGAAVVVESEVPSQVLPLDLSEPPEWLGHLATAGPDGGFALEDLAPGSHKLRVSAEGHAPEWISVEVPADGAAPEVLAHLGPGGGIAGVVVDADGHPIAGSVILASFAGTRLFSYEQTLTDADGHYSFEHLAPGIHMLIRWDTVAQAESGAAPDLRPAMVSLGRVTQLDFRADRASLRVVGRFFDASGAPVSRQKFTLLRPDANNLNSVEQWQAEVTDASGSYSIRVPGPGKYLVFATYGMGERLSLVDSFEAEAGVPELSHDVRLLATHAACTVLRADDRRPVASAMVIAIGLGDGGDEWFAGRAAADAAGVARLDGLPPGRYLLYAASDEATDLGQAASAPFEIPADGAAAALELLLPEGGALRVLAVDGAGAPLEGARVALRTERGAEVHLLVDPLTDRDGRITLLGLAPGAYAVTAEREGFAPATAPAEVRAALGGDLRIQLEPLR